MPKPTRRGFLATSGAALGVRCAIPLALSGSGRRIPGRFKTKSRKAMRAVERVVSYVPLNLRREALDFVKLGEGR